ncbi:ATP-grasp domain-containing protein [Porphyromonas levii]|uniref:ATP-grasp domain-containing protein n=1 Tax=Porphyromonas levii TaxID=28114 RepID=UPI001B8B90B5|nr:hypothetical protein [Porphyromonas levii]MBR8759095.1 hypothetical protein [Porphyromonas levii]MBR8762938.1 hypothetical protein [Porphyromonas levii]MBR8769044.1 hypothetical protein [Porphyromonas levii]
MKIAIAERKGSFSDHWIAYCKEHNIPYKCVNPYDTDIVAQVADCDAFMWHHHHGHYRDVVFAKQLLFSLEQAGKVVFPDFKTGWHFDDKLGQKYLFESLGIQAAKAWAFYDKESAYKWIEQTTFPKVFKLRGGAGSANVKLARTPQQAKAFVRKAFGRGYSASNPMLSLKTEWNRFIKGEGRFYDVAKYIALLLFPQIRGGNMLPRHKGYVYFQEFIPNEGFDYRLEIVGDKAIAMVRMARAGDFRASGGHDDRFDANLIPKDVIDFAFECSEKLGVQSVALDIVQEKETKKLYLIEVSYCYGVDDDEFAHGYWTRDDNHHQEPFNGIHWMIEKVIDSIELKKQ